MTCPTLSNARRYFNPRSPHGERLIDEGYCGEIVVFQSTLPARGATSWRKSAVGRAAFQSTLPARGATTRLLRRFCRVNDFNPRSPHGERRSCSITATLTTRYFNPRSPHGERRNPAAGGEAAQDFNPRSPHGERHCICGQAEAKAAFQSTLPARGATAIHKHCMDCSGDFNPRSPHGERPDRPRRNRRGLRISIHAPRTGSDKAGIAQRYYEAQFQSTLPARGATVTLPRIGHSTENFNPRSPHGERLDPDNNEVTIGTFQSTLPARGATLRTASMLSACPAFQSTLPARGATARHSSSPRFDDISIHAPRTGSDNKNLEECKHRAIFQSTLPARGAT